MGLGSLHALHDINSVCDLRQVASSAQIDGVGMEQFAQRLRVIKEWSQCQ